MWIHPFFRTRKGEDMCENDWGLHLMQTRNTIHFNSSSSSQINYVKIQVAIDLRGSFGPHHLRLVENEPYGPNLTTPKVCILRPLRPKHHAPLGWPVTGHRWFVSWQVDLVATRACIRRCARHRGGSWCLEILQQRGTIHQIPTKF